MKKSPLSVVKIKSGRAINCTGRLRFTAPPGFTAVGDFAAGWNGVSLKLVGSAVELQSSAAEFRAGLISQRPPAHTSSALLSEEAIPGGGIAFFHHVSRYDEPGEGKITALFQAGDALVRATAGFGRNRNRAVAFAEVLRIAKAAGPIPATGTEIAGLCVGAALFRLPRGRSEYASASWKSTVDDKVILTLRYMWGDEAQTRPTSNRPADVEVGASQIDGKAAETLIQIVEGRRGHALLSLQVPPAGATSLMDLSVELLRQSDGPSDQAPAAVLRAWFDGILATLHLAE